jgi:uncharacterized protein YggT (Ycf19 family)
MDTLDDKLAIDESQRLAQHEAVKAEVRSEINSEIARSAEQLDTSEQARAQVVGERLKDKAINEVENSEDEIEKARWAARISQIIDYVFYLIYGLITLEIFLDLLGARQGNAFREFIDTISAPALAPFRNLMQDPVNGRFQLRLSYIFALVFYILVHLAVNGLLRMIAHRKTSV